MQKKFYLIRGIYPENDPFCRKPYQAHKENDDKKKYIEPSSTNGRFPKRLATATPRRRPDSAVRRLRPDPRTSCSPICRSWRWGAGGRDSRSRRGGRGSNGLMVTAARARSKVYRRLRPLPFVEPFDSHEYQPTQNDQSCSLIFPVLNMKAK